MQLVPYGESLCYSLLAYALLAAAYAGWGGLLLKVMHVEVDAADRPFTRIWLGWAVALLLLLLVNFFLPLSLTVNLALFGAGIGLAVSGAVKRGIALSAPGPPMILFWAALSLVAVWVASWAMLTPQVYDSGLYHFNSVRWANEHPVPPGLGNLHIRLAYNQSFFVYAASLNLHPLFPYGHHVANSFLVLLLLAECLFHIMRGLGVAGDRFRVPDLFLSLGLAVPLVFLTVTAGLSSPAPDIAAAILEYVLLWQFIRLLEDRAAGRTATPRLTAVLVLAGATIAVKLSLLMYAATISALSLLVSAKNLRETGRTLLRPVLVAGGTACLLVMAWIAKGYVLSGFPLLPSSFAGIGFDWAVPVATVDLERKWITSWGRVPGGVPDEVLASWAWLKPWSQNLLRQQVNVIYPVAAACIAAVLAAGVNALPSIRSRVSGQRLLLLLPLPVLAGLAYWFLTAPDVRFTQALFFLLPISAAYVLFRSMPVKGGAGVLAAVCLAVLVNGGVGLWVGARASQIFTLPGVGYSAIPGEPLKVQTTDSGLQVLTTTTEGLCWNSPLPCTPYFNRDLRLRGTGLSSGFSVRRLNTPAPQ